MGKVIVVDDQPAVRLLLRTVIEQRGHEVVEAAAADEALSEVRAGPPDLILVDLNLPGTDGLEFIRRLRSSGWAGPVIVVSAGEWRPEEPLRSSLGIAGHLEKPFDLAVLGEAMDAAMGRGGPSGRPRPVV